MQKLTKVLVVILVIVMLAGLAACGQKDDGIFVGVFLRTIASNYYNATNMGALRAMEDWNKERGRNDTIQVYDHGDNIAKEINNVEDAINIGVDVAVINPIDPQGSIACMDMLDEAGVITINIDGMFNNAEKAQGRIQSRNEEGGELEMRKLCEALGGKGNILMFCNSANANSEIRKIGAMRALEDFPDINVLYIYDGETTLEKSLDAMQNFMQRFQADGIDGVWAFSDTISQGAAAAVSGTELEGKIKIAGLNGDVTSLELIKEGKQMGSAAQFPEVLGYEGVMMGLKMAIGEMEPMDPDDKVWLDMEWVDQSNVDEHIERWESMKVS
ncbi:MAG: sugar ABC transporter substrate-binding protein [Christensenellales bacterium]|jgi:ribose transport system substrate-binding protein